ncbi:MAG: hypothetical protein XXXNARYT_003545 [Candidatus Accumulibacter regalis]|jgi:hypothetical protein|uniref:hypothetical protein n=1 Tax=unclassified Candidatus Accumulibacter TaxID=2619054 RepID=UPI001AC20CA6|nr:MULTISPECIES: hypothetical protein [unclassified Candidatus Accumulibacter]MBN8515071.1 hypothetical protein [Accumulibacter sp.]
MVSHHEVILSAPRDLAVGGAPAILQRSDEDFIEAVLTRLRDADGRIGLRASLARSVSVAGGTDTRPSSKRNSGRGLFNKLRDASRQLGLAGGRVAAPPVLESAPGSDQQLVEGIRRSAEGAQVLKLFQPIQRQFNLAVMEARCDTPGEPRIDPTRVDSAGMVIRRLVRDSQGREVKQGWMRAGESLKGWARVGAAADGIARGNRHDPEALRRLSRPTTGQPVLDHEVLALLAAQEDALLNESVVPMFVAPPDVCKAAAATLFYGLIPTTSSEKAEGGAPGFDEAAFGPTTADFKAHLVGPLRGVADSLPRPGRALTPDMAGIAGNAADSERSAMKRFLLLLRQLAVEFDAFADSAEADALMVVLNGIALPLADADGKPVAGSRPAGDFLAAASRILLNEESISPAPTIPARWPALDTGTSEALARALSACLRVRFEAVSGVAGRFDDPEARYVLRAFVRLKPEGVCPARTVWGDYSPAFVIAPWYEGSGAPPVQVPLPDPGDKEMLKKLKPNVAFTVPASMQNLLSGDPLDLMDGKKPADSGLKLGWICSFNIPIITICAFIVLNIFLSLFDLFFRWMMFIKICIPFPKKGGGES